MHIIYLAHPIDRADQATGDHARAVAARLATHGYNVYRPGGAWHSTGEHLDPRLEQVNRTALHRADCVVALLPDRTPTIGVPMEIEAATALGIPTIVVTQVESFALAGNPRVRVIAHDGFLTEAVAEALATHSRPRITDLSLFKVVLNHHDDPAPSRAHHDDAGYDLHTADDTLIPPGETVSVPTTVAAIQLPPGVFAAVVGRSSTYQKGLHVPFSVIDPGWRGHLAVVAHNLTRDPIKVSAGDRIGQVVLLTNTTPTTRIELTAQVDPHRRGLNGFGSTGS